MNYLTLDDIRHVAARTLDVVEIRDIGLLESAVLRPQATAFGQDAYPTLPLKAAALFHSLARHRAVLDGNKRLALAGTIAFLGINGERLTLTNDEAYDLVISVASGELDDVTSIAKALKAGTSHRP
jgi:death-on-curing protein